MCEEESPLVQREGAWSTPQGACPGPQHACTTDTDSLGEGEKNQFEEETDAREVSTQRSPRTSRRLCSSPTTQRSATEGNSSLESEVNASNSPIHELDPFSSGRNCLGDFSYKSPNVMSSPVKAERLKNSSEVVEKGVLSSPVKGKGVTSSPVKRKGLAKAEKDASSSRVEAEFSGNAPSPPEAKEKDVSFSQPAQRVNSASRRAHAPTKAAQSHPEYPVTADTVVAFDMEAVTARLKHLYVQQASKEGMGGASSGNHSHSATVGGASSGGHSPSAEVDAEQEEEGGAGERGQARFRAKIEPSSNKAAEEELRQEIK